MEEAERQPCALTGRGVEDLPQKSSRVAPSEGAELFADPNVKRGRDFRRELEARQPASVQMTTSRRCDVGPGGVCVQPHGHAQ